MAETLNVPVWVLIAILVIVTVYFVTKTLKTKSSNSSIKTKIYWHSSYII